MIDPLSGLELKPPEQPIDFSALKDISVSETYPKEMPVSFECMEKLVRNSHEPMVFFFYPIYVLRSK